MVDKKNKTMNKIFAVSHNEEGHCDVVDICFDSEELAEKYIALCGDSHYELNQMDVCQQLPPLPSFYKDGFYVFFVSIWLKDGYCYPIRKNWFDPKFREDEDNVFFVGIIENYNKWKNFGGNVLAKNPEDAEKYVREKLKEYLKNHPEMSNII